MMYSNKNKKLTVTQFDACILSDVGCVRANNEDNFLLSSTYNEHSFPTYHVEKNLNFTKPSWFYTAVFDGMGGGEKGEWASLVTAQQVRETFSHVTETTSYEEIDCLAQRSFQLANNQIVQEREHSGVFGTTGTLLCSDGNCFKLYHLGDSRAYIFRDGSLIRLTQDQTLAEMKLRLGFYQNEDEVDERERHQLTSYIGCDASLENLQPKQYGWNVWQKKDILLLCSDGLYEMCSEEEMITSLQISDTVKEMAKRLMNLALEHGGVDNITCVLVQKLM